MKSISKLKDEARRHEQREEWERAIQAYLQVIRISDEAGEGEVELPLFNRIGDLCVRLGRPHDAVRYYEEAADRYADADLYNNAIALCNKALRYQPDHLELMRKLGQFSASQGFLTDARRYFLEYAERKFKSGEVDAALSALADFAGVVDDGEIRELLGRRLHAYGRDEEAVRELRTAYTMYVHTGETGRAEAVRVAIHDIDPGVSLDAPAAAPAGDPFAEPAIAYDDLPRFEPLGTGTDAPAPPPVEAPPAPESVEDLQRTDHTDEEPVVDLPFLDIDEDRPPAYEAPTMEPVAGFESSVIGFAADAPDLTELDLGSDIERDETSFDVPADEREFLLPETPADAAESWDADTVDAAGDDDSSFDLPLLTDTPPTGYELPLLDDADSFDESPLPFLQDDVEAGDAPLPLLDEQGDGDDSPLPLLDGDDEYDAPLPLLEPMAPHPAPAEPTRPETVFEAVADAGVAGPEPEQQPSVDDMREFDLASFEDDPPSFRMPELDGTPSRPLDLPPLELPDFDLRGHGTAEPFIFEVEEPAAPEPLFRTEDLTPYGSGDDSGAGAGGVPDDLEIPSWIDAEGSYDTESTELTDLPSGFDDVAEVPAPDAPAEPAWSGVGPSDGDVMDGDDDTDADDVAFTGDLADDGLAATADAPDPFAPFAFELEDFAIPGAPTTQEPKAGAKLPEWALTEDDEDVDYGPSHAEGADADAGAFADPSGADAPESQPAVWDMGAPGIVDDVHDVHDVDDIDDVDEAPGSGLAFGDDGVTDTSADDLQILDVPAELEWGGRAASEFIAEHQAEPSAQAGPADDDLLAGPDPVVDADPYEDHLAAPAASADDLLDEGANEGPDGGWSPDDLIEPEPPAAGQAAAASPVDETTDDDGFIDLGAMLRADEERTTRFYVQETPPTGDEDRDFAELLNQFKAKISEHVPAEDATAHYDLALAYKEMGLFDEAIYEFQIALRAGRMRLKIYEELGECFLHKRQFNIAEKVLNRALTANHEDELELLGVYYHLGRAYEEMGRTEQARDAYERVLGMDIGFQDVAERLARL